MFQHQNSEPKYQISAITGRIGLTSRHVVSHVRRSSSVPRMMKAPPNSADLYEQFVLGGERTFR